MRPTRRRLLIDEEEEDHSAAEQVIVANPPVAQPVLRHNSSTFVGLPGDPRLEDLAYSGFRAALDSGFDFDLNLSLEANKRRVLEWRGRTSAQVSILFSPTQVPSPPQSSNLPTAEIGKLSLMDSIMGAEYKDPKSVGRSSAQGKKKRKRGDVASDTPTDADTIGTLATPDVQVTVAADSFSPPSVQSLDVGIVAQVNTSISPSSANLPAMGDR